MTAADGTAPDRLTRRVPAQRRTATDRAATDDGDTDPGDSGRPTELTILLPCLDEAETLASCISKAQRFLERTSICGEVLVADNGSTDGSVKIARSMGARVAIAHQRGYGSALNAGIAAARGRYVIMGDADDSYDFESLDAFVDMLRGGSDLVMGNRFEGGVQPGAMPWLHRRIGNPLLSWVGRRFFRVPVRDFHCGLRAFDRRKVIGLGLHTTGMEWASELVVAASMAEFEIGEVPTTLAPDGRSRRPHLRSFHDGWRHLRFLLLYSPRWLFLYPGLTMFLIGLAMSIALTIRPITIGDVGFDIGTLILASGLCIIGYSVLWFAIISRDFASRERLLPENRQAPFVHRHWSLERGLAMGSVLMAMGVVVAIASLWRWRSEGFGPLDGQQTVRSVVPALLGLVLGAQTIFSSLFWSMLQLPTHRGDD